MSLRYASIADIPKNLLPGNAQAPAKKPSKYRAVPIVLDGIRFDSKLEARCYQWIDLRWKAGEVLWYARQVSFDLPGGVKYRADFVVALAGGGVEVIDAKGYLNDMSRLKIKQMKAIHNIDVILWSDKK